MINPYICVLLYGGQPAHALLHKRILTPLLNTLPPKVLINVWANTVGDPTLEFLQANKGRINTTISPANKPKYKAMAEMFNVPKVDKSYNWVLWFDDDTTVFLSDWYNKTSDYINSRQADNVSYIGQPWMVYYLEGQQEFVKQSNWYKQVPFERKNNRDIVTFAQGAYWWLNADLMRDLDWPDVRLNHNGGDTLLGEAVRQQGKPFHKFNYGVKPNDAPRRGYCEKPAGSVHDIRR